MEAFSSRTFERRLEALPLQALSKVLGTEFQSLKGNFWRGSRSKIMRFGKSIASIEAPQG